LHLRLIKAGDNLPALCFEIYGDPGYYLQVARANNIDNFRNLIPGTKVFFPPLEK
jgi:nucleoid-associated protein YgaU